MQKVSSFRSECYVINFLTVVFVFCNIGLLMTQVSIEHKTEEWLSFLAHNHPSESSVKNESCPLLLLDIG